jgi:hypothetical protein
MKKKDRRKKDEKNGTPSCLFQITIFLFLCIGCCSCQRDCCNLEPNITYSPSATLIKILPSAFPPLEPQERRQDWGKELLIANDFALEMDFYRAITCYKRSLILLPKKYRHRKPQIEYGIIQSYYFGEKYNEAIDAYLHSTLTEIPPSFPATNDLLIILYDSYLRTGQDDEACRIFSIIQERDSCLASRLDLSIALSNADFATIDAYAAEDESVNTFLEPALDFYRYNAKSVCKAQVLNAVLPGAGYLYVGQKQTALTSFLLNTLFTAAAYHFFDNGNFAAGLILSSLEMGWYIGGINGAGLAAKELNERLYDTTITATMVQTHLFPILMLEYAF